MFLNKLSNSQPRFLLKSLQYCAFYSIEQFFNRMSKVIRDCIGFALLRSVIGLENSRHLDQSDARLKPIASRSLAFSRAWGRLHVFTLSSHWLLVIFSFVPIGRCDYFGFGFTTLNRKALYLTITLPWFRSSTGLLNVEILYFFHSFSVLFISTLTKGHFIWAR